MRYFLLLLLALVVRPVVAQGPPPPKQQYYTFVDTAGIAPVAPRTYIAMVFARSVNSDKAPPVSRITVLFDCTNGMVKRTSHVVYRWNADSTAVWGPEVMDTTGWVPHNPNIPTFDMVCRIGDAKFKPESPFSAS